MKMVQGAAATGVLMASLVKFATAGKVTPTQKVIEMLTEMHAKGEKDMNEEQKVFFFYKEWVEDQTRSLGFSIETGAKNIDELIAFIEKSQSDAKGLGRKIEKLDAEIEKLEGERAEATRIRKEERAEYTVHSKDVGESVDALQRAIDKLSSQDFTRPQAEMLLQRMSKTLRGMPQVLAAFMEEQGRGSLRGDGAPAVAAYESQSGGILSMLEGLEKKFSAELAEVEEDETNRQHNYDMLLQHTTDTIDRDDSDRTEKIALKEKKFAAAAEAKGELVETRKAKAADEALKKETSATFEEKAAVYEENQKVRKDELAALGKAVEIISSPSVDGSYAKRVNAASLTQLAPVSFLQVGSSAPLDRAVALLAEKAHALNSRALLRAASGAQGGGFDKVARMIEDLIAKLKEEAAAEAEHKKWCDKELKANKHKRNKKTAQKQHLDADMEAMQSNIEEMAENIEKLLKEQQDLTESMGKATQVREEEKAENLAIIADSAAGFKAVGKAIVVLKEFYSAQASSFLQQVPEMEAYSGQQSGNKGVVGMLEVIQTDFRRLEAETTTAEKAAVREYDSFMKESAALKKLKHEEEFKLKLEKDQVEYERSETKKDLKSVEKELAMANKYYEELKPACTEVKVSYEERVARRKEEIEALKEAYNILDEKSD